ncbi:LysR family transcriptional regulator [Dictyobacter sp. S3.2.2.5]|uniref:LysR family transcriptional regulator n=1 Tax=Dictyobacter halimunensis TaxID=3026934 RepID=A0ABQ6FKA6_9CHLR|nr:LysR family transcriptional regulator [Dictyobacter sp. S3.2.2.5]
MELRSLHYFIAVAETLHFSRAAERLHIAQPPLSQQIQRLEKEMGVQLFERTKRSVRLSAAGEVFLQEAYRTLAQAEQSIHAARAADRGEIGRLALGFVGSSAYGMLPAMIQAFRERFPQVELILREWTTVEQVQALHKEEIQIGFVRPPILDATLHHLTVQQEPFLVAVPVKHPLATSSSVSLSALADDPFIFVPSKLAPGLSHQMMDMCLQAGFQPRIAQEAIQFHVIISLVAAGLGIALVPACIRTFQRPDVVYLPLQDSTIQAEIQMVRQRAGHSVVMHNFLDVVKAHTTEAQNRLSF